MTSDLLSMNNDKLDALWLHAAGLSIDQCVVDDFQGRELVATTLTGSFSNMTWAGRRLVFYMKRGLIYGHHLKFGFIKRCYFFLQVQMNEIDGKDMLIMNYDVPENGDILKASISHLRMLKEYDLYLGRFNGGSGRTPKFMGYFMLSA